MTSPAGAMSDPCGGVEWGAASDDARRAGAPIVALESSVLAQGLKPPANREADRRMRTAIRALGAHPAITGVVSGRATLGLEDATVERFLASGAPKVSARDLAWAVARGLDGATTVAAALAIASRAGVDVFATGGIGGVHRGSAHDESADLLELSRSSVVTVCAGAKAFLDLPATVERLETYGVPVVGYRTDEFPGFFTARTGLPVAAVADGPEDVARTLIAARALGRAAAVLVVQAPPAADALDADVVESAVAEALRAAAAAGVHGGAVTPFLLAAVERATGGASVRANLAILESNARLAAEIAIAVDALRGRD